MVPRTAQASGSCGEVPQSAAEASHIAQQTLHILLSHEAALADAVEDMQQSEQASHKN